MVKFDATHILICYSLCGALVKQYIISYQQKLRNKMASRNADINKTVTSAGMNSVVRRQQHHYSSLKQSVLQSFEHVQYSSINKQSKTIIFFFEMVAMFVFVYGMVCYKVKHHIDFLAVVSALLSVVISARLSGANINLSITLSNVIRKENKYRFNLLGLYFAAQMFGSLLALVVAEVLNGKSLPVFVPDDENFFGCFRVLLAEIIGTFILVFFILQISNPNTTFIDNELSAFIFIVTFIHIGRKFAPTSKNSINIAITLSSAIMAASKAQYSSLAYCLLWISGDVIGAVIATFFYDNFFEPNVEFVRKGKRNSENCQYDSLIKQHFQTYNQQHSDNEEQQSDSEEEELEENEENEQQEESLNKNQALQKQTDDK